MVNASDCQLEARLHQWMRREHRSFHKTRAITKTIDQDIKKRAMAFVMANVTNRYFKVLSDGGRPISVVTLYPHPNPRTKHQQLIAFYYDHRFRREALAWLKKRLVELGTQAPKATCVNAMPDDEEVLRRSILKAGFNIRYELLTGTPSVALRELIRQKNPPEDLRHLGLEVRSLKSQDEIDEAIKLQRKVSLQSKRHTYFSHTRDQLDKDRREYVSVIKKGTGMILGVYKKDRLVGLMTTTIFSANPKDKMAGFSFFIDRSIQGQGVASTGYRILLPYLIKRKVPTFIGGTSQPAIKKLGKIMKRDLRLVSFVKMG